MRNIERNERRMTPAALRAANDGNLKNFMAAITPGGIEAQEKAGQLDEAARETLPIELRRRRNESAAEARKPWEALGFRFGKTVDEIFVETKFPKGWKKKPTDHSMWSEIVDDKGRVRGMIFYKAAFYDRSAHAHLSRRFDVMDDYAKPLATISVKDACGEASFKVSGLEQPDWSGDRAEAERREAKKDEARQICLQFLRTNYPDYENPCAYWG